MYNTILILCGILFIECLYVAYLVFKIRKMHKTLEILRDDYKREMDRLLLQFQEEFQDAIK